MLLGYVLNDGGIRLSRIRIECDHLAPRIAIDNRSRLDTRVIADQLTVRPTAMVPS